MNVFAPRLRTGRRRRRFSTAHTSTAAGTGPYKRPGEARRHQDRYRGDSLRHPKASIRSSACSKSRSRRAPR
jgi:hypothetical protein